VYVERSLEFEQNGEKTLSGVISLERDDGAVVVRFSLAPVLGEKLCFSLTKTQQLGLADFFRSDYIKFWKLTILTLDSPYEHVLCVLGFERSRSGLVLHLSTDDGRECNHFEGLVDNVLLSWLPSIFPQDIVG